MDIHLKTGVIYINITKKDLEERIFDKGLMLKDIAKEYNCSPGTISNYVKKFGIDISKRKKTPSKDELYEEYVIGGKSVDELAKKYHFAISKVRNLLTDNGISIRNKGSNQFNLIVYEDVLKMFKDSGCHLLSTEYKNVHSLLEYRCSCGNTAKISLAAFKRGQRCKKCGTEKMAKAQRHSLEYVKSKFEEKGCTLLSTTYKNAQQKLDYICHCGHKASMSFGNFNAGYDCSNCKRLMSLGENNHNYNPNLTDEERQELGRYEEGYKAFRRKVYKRDGFKCVICHRGKSGTLVAHHLESYAQNKALRTDVDNAVTLCETCHKDFHSNYGYGNNTKEQFEEFKRKSI